MIGALPSKSVSPEDSASTRSLADDFCWQDVNSIRSAPLDSADGGKLIKRMVGLALDVRLKTHPLQ
jgi:hypothetical protein